MAFIKGNTDLVVRAATGLRMVVETLLLPSADDEAAGFDSVRQSVAALIDDYVTQRAATALASQAWVEQLASAARTASTNGPDQVNTTARGVLVVLDLTAFTTAASVQLTIERKNAAGTYTQIAASAALAEVNRLVVLLDPLAGTEPAGVGDSVSAGLPNGWRVRVVHGNANSHTYSVTAYPIR
ncbi:MAG TPA: hypothetical protein VJP78_09505 [Thermoleophilia bacterium]|nr:hypothetical protein [Thermoleophilia bacterium]